MNAEDFQWEAGACFFGNIGDMIEDIRSIVLRDGLLIIAGLKQKGNE